MGCQITGGQSPWRINFVRRRLIFVRPQYGNTLMSPFWRPDFEMTPRFLEKSVRPWYIKISFVLHMHSQFGTMRGHGSQIYVYIGPKNISKLAVYCAARDKYTSIQEILHYGLPRRGLCYVDLRSTCFTPLRFNAPCQHHFSIYAPLFRFNALGRKTGAWCNNRFTAYWSDIRKARDTALDCFGQHPFPSHY